MDSKTNKLEELEQKCQGIRDEILRVVSKNGGN